MKKICNGNYFNHDKLITAVSKSVVNFKNVAMLHLPTLQPYISNYELMIGAYHQNENHWTLLV